VEVTADDLRRLQQEEFLNDTVIDVWLKKMTLELVRPIRVRFASSAFPLFHLFHLFPLATLTLTLTLALTPTPTPTRRQRQ